MQTGEPRIRTPDTLPCKKYRGKYNGNNLHVAIGDWDNRPVEIQITIADLDLATQDRSYANADFIQALLNMLLQHEDPYSIEYMLEVIGKVSRRKGDLPGRIVEIMEQHCAGMEA